MIDQRIDLAEVTIVVGAGSASGVSLRARRRAGHGTKVTFYLVNDSRRAVGVKLRRN